MPTAIKVYNWVLTLWKGNIHMTVPMMFAIGFIFTFTHGGLTGLFLTEMIIWTGTDQMGADIRVSKFAALFVVAVWNFILRKTVLFSEFTPRPRRDTVV